MSKLCVTCKDSIDDLTQDVFSKDDEEIPDWFKEIGNYSLLPPPLNRNSRFNLFLNKKNKIPLYPRKYDTKLTINISKFIPNSKNNWIFFWGSKKRKYKYTVYPQPANAYEDFSNCGLVKQDDNGDITLKFHNPTPYQYKNIKYPPHLHFVYLEENNLWNYKCNTIIITPNISLKTFKQTLKYKNYLIICSLPNKSKLQLIPNTIKLPYDTNLHNIIYDLYKSIPTYLLDNYTNIRNIPIIIYCKDKKCNASEKLIYKLRKLKFINITTYKGGINEYFKKI